jgi:translation initiation factor IF-2
LIKNLKLNIKNAQLAGVLQKQTTPELATKKTKASPLQGVAETAADDKITLKSSLARKNLKDHATAPGTEEVKPKRAKIVARAEKAPVKSPIIEVAEEAKSQGLSSSESTALVQPNLPSVSGTNFSLATEKADIASIKNESLADKKADIKLVQNENFESMIIKSSPEAQPTVPEKREVRTSEILREIASSPTLRDISREPHGELRKEPRFESRQPYNPLASRESRPPYSSRDPKGPLTTRDPRAPYIPREGQAPLRTLREQPPRDPRFAMNRERRPYSDNRAPNAPGSYNASSPTGPGGRDFSRPRDPRFGSDNRSAPMGSRPLRPATPGVIRESFSDRQARSTKEQQEKFNQEHTSSVARPRLGPTGRHFRDLVPARAPTTEVSQRHTDQEKAQRAQAHAQKRREVGVGPVQTTSQESDENKASSRTRLQDKSKLVKPAIKKSSDRIKIDTTRIDEDARWRKRRPAKKSKSHEDTTIRPNSLSIRLPIAVKDLAQEMKLKSSQLISKLFLQGLAVTLNDVLDDETTVQLLGHEFGCEISVDKKEEERIRVTNKTINEEITNAEQQDLVPRPPVVAFMGHVDHGKTSLIDFIRSSNRVSHEAGAITQHIGAFSCTASHGELTILDTPGHEAFTAMRERGAQITDVIVLVIAGDEGIKPQTEEAIRHARSVNATILVAINKCDKPNFNIDTVYRQLSEQNLLPEAWGGKIITVKCSAVTGEGIAELLEMIALQADVLELRANPLIRARGTVIEAELHKGLGNVATVLVQNGCLNPGDALVFNQSFGRVKTMRDEFNTTVVKAKPSQAVRITGLSSLPEAGEEFIVVASEKEARTIAEARAQLIREKQVQVRKKVTMEALLQQAQPDRKVLHCILRADVQGSIEALRYELIKIKSDKVDINIVSESIGEVSESDVQLAAASGAVIIGFHTRIEAHAEELIKRHKVKVRSFDVIYHAVDGVRELMAELLDKIPEETFRGRAEVKTIFKSSQLGKIPGCQISEGIITRSNRVRVHRQNKIIWDGSISSLRRGKDDIREVNKGFECGILLNGFNDVEEGDIFEAYEITYHTQSL